MHKISIMKKIYQVGGHKFALFMPDNELLWKEMGPYDPFLTDDGDDVLQFVNSKNAKELPMSRVLRYMTGKTNGCWMPPHGLPHPFVYISLRIKLSKKHSSYPRMTLGSLSAP